MCEGKIEKDPLKYFKNTNFKVIRMRDYKFYCFDGKVKFLYVSEGLEDHNTAKISFLTPDWEFAPFKRNDYMPFLELPQKLLNYGKMI